MSGDLVQSVQRAFQILQTVSDHEDGVGVSAIAEQTGLHTSTASRLITTLESINALSRVDGGSQLILGEGLIDLVSRAPWAERMIARTRPFLHTLATQTRESVGLTRLENGRCHVFFQIESDRHVRIRDWTGHRFPLHVTSSGKLWMANWSDSKLTNYFAQPVEKPASETITDLAQFKTELTQIQQDGIAWTIDELEDGLLSIAAPLTTADYQETAALYLSAPAYRFKTKTARNKLAQLMQDTATKINILT